MKNASASLSHTLRLRVYLIKKSHQNVFGVVQSKYMYSLGLCRKNTNTKMDSMLCVVWARRANPTTLCESAPKNKCETNKMY